MRGCGEHLAYDPGCPWCWTANLEPLLTDTAAPVPPDEPLEEQ